MRVRIFDCWMHEHDIRDALERPADDTGFDGPDSRLALDEIAASMGFVVGKLGGAPDGSRVRLELTGPLQRTINVAVDGRGRVVDDFGGDEPTATITLDGLLFTRLAGGRTHPGPALGRGFLRRRRGRGQADRRAPQLRDLSWGNTPGRDENLGFRRCHWRTIECPAESPAGMRGAERFRLRASNQGKRAGAGKRPP